jgi:hypothetical protein
VSWLQRHADLEGHFSGASSTRSDRRLFGHLKSCAACRDEYRTLAMLEALEVDGAERAQSRMRRSLFEPAPRRALVGGGFVVAFASLALVISLGRAPSPFHSNGFASKGLAASGFAARGSVPGYDAPMPSLAIYRVPRERGNEAVPAVAETQRAGNVLHAGESLAFSYVNPASVGACCVMVFARDAAGHVFWFWPAWENAGDDPQSLPIAASGSPVELTQAVRHELLPGPLTIVGLFTPKPLHVHEVEGAIANGLPGLQAFPGHVWTETLEVSQ